MTPATGCLYMAVYMENTIASLFPNGTEHRSKSQSSAINTASLGHSTRKKEVTLKAAKETLKGLLS